MYLIVDTYYAVLQEMSELPVQARCDNTVQSSEEIKERISRWTAALSEPALFPYFDYFGLCVRHLCPIQTLCNFFEYCLTKQMYYPGHLLEIGSSKYSDETEVPKVLDYLYIIRCNAQVLADEQQGLYRVFRGLAGTEIRPWELIAHLADCVDKIMSEICLPCPLQHGGYASPDYSGVRINGPVISVSIQYPRMVGYREIPLQITPAFLLQTSCEEYKYVQGRIERIQVGNLNHRLKSPYSRDFRLDVHVVPHPLKNMWQPSTAYVEYQITKQLSGFLPLGKAFAFARTLMGHQEKHRQWGHLPTNSPSDESVSITHALERYSQITDEREKNTYRLQLNTKMRYQHIYLPPEERSKFREVSKSAISVNTATLEHIIWSSAIETSSPFSSCSRDWELRKTKITRQLVRDVYKELANTESLSVCHALLPLTLSKFSVLPSSLDEATQLVNTVQGECAAMLDTFLKDDFVSPVSFSAERGF